MASNGNPQFENNIFPLQSNGAAGERFNASVGKIKPRFARFPYPPASLNRFAAARDRAE